MNVVINAGIGEFLLSKEAVDYLISLGWSYEDADVVHKNSDKNIDIMYSPNKEYYAVNFCKHDVDSNEFRTNKDIIKMAETLGNNAFSDTQAVCKIIQIPDDVEWYIENDSETSGYEEIHEKHRIWN